MSKIEEQNEGQIIAKARDKFFEDNPELFEGEAKGQYLKNRLERAFIAGYAAALIAKEMEKEDDIVQG